MKNQDFSVKIHIHLHEMDKYIEWNVNIKLIILFPNTGTGPGVGFVLAPWRSFGTNMVHVTSTHLSA